MSAPYTPIEVTLPAHWNARAWARAEQRVRTSRHRGLDPHRNEDRRSPETILLDDWRHYLGCAAVLRHARELHPDLPPPELAPLGSYRSVPALGVWDVRTTWSADHGLIVRPAEAEPPDRIKILVTVAALARGGEGEVRALIRGWITRDEGLRIGVWREIGGRTAYRLVRPPRLHDPRELDWAARPGLVDASTPGGR